MISPQDQLRKQLSDIGQNLVRVGTRNLQLWTFANLHVSVCMCSMKFTQIPVAEGKCSQGYTEAVSILIMTFNIFERREYLQMAAAKQCHNVGFARYKICNNRKEIVYFAPFSSL